MQERECWVSLSLGPGNKEKIGEAEEEMPWVHFIGSRAWGGVGERREDAEYLLHWLMGFRRNWKKAEKGMLSVQPLGEEEVPEEGREVSAAYLLTLFFDIDVSLPMTFLCQMCFIFCMTSYDKYFKLWSPGLICCCRTCYHWKGSFKIQSHMSNILKFMSFSSFSSVGCFKEGKIIVHCTTNISSRLCLKMHAKSSLPAQRFVGEGHCWQKLVQRAGLCSHKFSYKSQSIFLVLLRDKKIWLSTESLTKQLDSTKSTHCHLQSPESKGPQDAFVLSS